MKKVPADLVGCRIQIIGTHPWRGSFGVVEAWEKIHLLGKMALRVALEDAGACYVDMCDIREAYDSTQR